MKTKLRYNEALELRGSGLHFDSKKGYFTKTENGYEYFTKKEASQISRILSAERARLNIENRELYGKSMEKVSRERVARLFKPQSFKPLLEEKKNKGAFKERQRLVRSMAEDDYIINLLSQYFPNISITDAYLAMTPEKGAAIMAKVISPYAATARLMDPEGALSILGISSGEETPNE